jgi:hypothetical protein
MILVMGLKNILERTKTRIQMMKNVTKNVRSILRNIRAPFLAKI